MRRPPKIVDSCGILGIFNTEKIRGPSKIVDSCAILDILVLKKMRGSPKYVCVKVRMEQ